VVSVPGSRAGSFADWKEAAMSSRKRTVDDLDDIDDEDGVLEEEIAQESDLTLVVETAEEVLEGTDPKLEGPPNPDELEDEISGASPEEEV
jgi:hypothetical protein